MIRKLKSALFYAGVDRLSFDRAKSKIQKANLTMVTVLSSFATILITVMFISSFGSEGIKQNRIVYIIGLVMSLSILILSITIAKKYSKIITLLIYLSYLIYYMYGILIGTITDPTGKTVTFMVLLVFMPILFIDRPLNIIFVTSIYQILFIVLCLLTKTGAVLTVDILDAIIFGILGSASGSVVNHMKIKGYVLEQQLQEISRIDQLTQMRNRNAYEFERYSIPDLCRHSLTCIYIDVNGLHELNNEKGHELGDKMLQQIAIEVKYAFNEDLSYRIGGDEFITFLPDKSDEDIRKIIQELVEKIEMKNYHVAIGYESCKIRHLSIENLIKTAESKMFRDKKRYYKNIANRDMRNQK